MAKMLAASFKSFTLLHVPRDQNERADLLFNLANHDKAKYAIKEVHDEVCRTYIGGQKLASKVAKADYYWLTLKRDCTEFIKKLEEVKGRWAEELPQVLWSYHTTPPHSTTQETPFRLMFEIDAVILIEIDELSPRAIFFQPAQNEEEIRANLDLLQEV
ncbi:hypothetical protein CR513_58928, partial [Mucuna pruriens]